MFNIEKELVGRGLSKNQIDEIKAQVRNEFPLDDMMYELHLVRLIDALQKGYCTIQNILPPSQKQQAR
ncbi:MAG: hypothetical protein A2W61_03695 [Deltaproteobacteria bacterium RIFCSPLOWO2_01_44_7]|nr:MAG: hypothetical protein A2712_06680 [Deltaproteobacteria bacterium RIFCSPHIGHO2_01_FULL_43_49]OGQ15638.1 MAG: hypothetical protein A3D22_05470 [Deltaproteobacteria bacterium RIFCSPHIGHO2_02_FULL_44_53]OGQ28607.1 MAG: hypothetical protein A3D98_00205 [Deltaproteobacteria bacterium RIFCSPHIGHO2_12_FULL_44_21]OGQ31929.1 MAG: hypothetical protein A2979_02410 [Deltaproteobacteria bacterium RIFCSPLOWO2_01_FULL_45_74]OGQ38471.1 MAG: hypothetical protein A2W61_03695 [Deltaproteobacteria bacterium 